MEPRFKVGQLVCLRADPSRCGPVLLILPPAGGLLRYRVFHSPIDIREYHEDQLAAMDAVSASDALVEAISAGRWLEVDVFRARLTSSRLAHPQVDNLYALQAARIQYIPFQFKPLLRFLRADQPRLLIADEVGVGKTIEAGLILKELQTRQQVGNVLIVCPKALVPKWRMEMRRFDEDFRPLTGETLRYCLKEAHLDGAWPAQYARAIAHLELLRIDEYLTGVSGRHSRPGLLELNPPPHFSLIIIDEAHHLRSPGTNSHELARFLCDLSEAVLFLSATPVHLGSRNLYTLLNLLHPDLFPDESVFNEIVEPNRYMTQAMRHVRSRLPKDTWQTEAATGLGTAAGTSWGRRVLCLDPRFTEWHKRLQEKPVLSDTERIRCLRDLEEVHSLAHVMNRTRRRDIGRFTLRDPHTVSVSFTPEQQRFYDALISFRQEMLLQQYDPQVVRLVTDILERQAASCLPALIPALDVFLRSGRFSIAELSDDIESEEGLAELPAHLVQRAQELRNMAAILPAKDPKLDELLKIIVGTMTGNSPGKVLVFSFFLHTLAYLEKRLRETGHRVATITGQVEDSDREHLRERFRLPREHEPALDVLLSSEVGCEGLDYEFCDRLVNYDIPWNPMRIEQRIGRIDRFGQTAEKVLIFNFITPGTVEERIFFRCFERLGIFRDTIGDLEDILGDVVQDLTQLALDPTLTPEQAEERARQTADNAIRLMEERRRMEEESGALLGLDQAFVEEIDDLVAEGRFVSPDDLRLMIERFLDTSEIGGRITPDEQHSGMYRLRLKKEGRTTLLEKVRALGRNDRPTISFIRWLDGNEPQLLLTFDQKTALEARDVPFVTPIHPLARIAIAHWGSVTDPLVSHLLIFDNATPAGRYLFTCDLWETLAVKQEVRLVGFAWNLDGHCLIPEISSGLMRLLSRATKPPESIAVPASTLEEALRCLDEKAHRLQLSALGELREKNDALVARKLASLDAYYRNRLQRVRTEMERAVDERIVRMKEAERERIERDYERKRKEIEGRRDADIVRQRIAAGILEVKHGDGL